MKRLSPRRIERMMKKLGMHLETIDDATYVEIHRSGGEIIRIDNPVITKMSVSGKVVFQVAGGEVKVMREEVRGEEVKIPEEDIALVAQQAGVDSETARKALIAAKGDLAKAIMMIRSGAGGI